MKIESHEIISGGHFVRLFAPTQTTGCEDGRPPRRGNNHGLPPLSTRTLSGIPEMMACRAGVTVRKSSAMFGMIPKVSATFSKLQLVASENRLRVGRIPRHSDGAQLYETHLAATARFDDGGS
jgi:hypothetical protein